MEVRNVKVSCASGVIIPNAEYSGDSVVLIPMDGNKIALLTAFASQERPEKTVALLRPKDAPNCFKLVIEAVSFDTKKGEAITEKTEVIWWKDSRVQRTSNLLKKIGVETFEPEERDVAAVERIGAHEHLLLELLMYRHGKK